MNTDDYFEDDPLPADDVVTAFTLADFDQLIDRSRAAGNPTAYTSEAIHMRGCPDRQAVDLAAHSAAMCGEGTCEYPPRIAIHITCPHWPLLGVEHWVEGDTMGELLGRIAAFADAR